MKLKGETKMKPFAIILFLTFAHAGLAQIEIDQPIELTGSDGNRAMRNLEAPVDGTDAVNKDYVDNAVSGSGGGGRPTMISNESPASYNLMNAALYCNGLSEGGHSDWYLPSLDELVYVVSKGGVAVSNSSSSNAVWIRSPINSGNTSSGRWQFRFSDGGLALASWPGGSVGYVRCVR